jgi:siroheme decarboxylase
MKFTSYNTPMMDDIDRKLLNYIQVQIPHVPRPFAEIGKAVGISEEEAIQRTRRLKELGIIRRFGAIFVTPKMGFASALIAAKVPADRIDDVVKIINSYHLVTHNYERSHEINLWFTVMAESTEKLEVALDEMKDKTGIDNFQILRSIKVFKIKAAFNLETEED